MHKPPFSDDVNHPLVDLTGAECGVHQSGSVRFLGGAVFDISTTAMGDIVRNDCVVPSPKALFSRSFLPPDDLLSFIGEGPGGFGSGTYFHPGISCGTVDDGYYVLLAPFSQGAHTVHFHGELPASNYVLEITYNLTVE